MALIRTVLALIVLVILAHVVLYYLDYTPDTNEVVAAVYSLGALLESPAEALLTVLPLSPEQRGFVNDNSFYVVALSAAGIYFILYLLLGVGRR